MSRNGVGCGKNQACTQYTLLDSSSKFKGRNNTLQNCAKAISAFRYKWQTQQLGETLLLRSGCSTKATRWLHTFCCNGAMSHVQLIPFVFELWAFKTAKALLGRKTFDLKWRVKSAHFTQGQSHMIDREMWRKSLLAKWTAGEPHTHNWSDTPHARVNLNLSLSADYYV